MFAARLILCKLLLGGRKREGKTESVWRCDWMAWCGCWWCGVGSQAAGVVRCGVVWLHKRDVGGVVWVHKCGVGGVVWVQKQLVWCVVWCGCTSREVDERPNQI